MSDLAADIRALSAKATVLGLEMQICIGKCAGIMEDAEGIAARIVERAPELRSQVEGMMASLRQAAERLGIKPGVGAPERGTPCPDP